MEIKDIINGLKPSMDKASALLQTDVCEEEKVFEEELNKISDYDETNLPKYLEELSNLTKHFDRFMNKCNINCSNLVIRNRRLALLKMFKDKCDKFTDFSQLS